MIFLAAPAQGGEGVVERVNACEKGTLIIKTTEGDYVVARQETAGSRFIDPGEEPDEGGCMFFPGDQLEGELDSIGSVTLTNSSRSQCDLIIEDVVFNMQEAVEALGVISQTQIL